ncbi:MAG: TPM domain-containing protein [Anaerolineales bacterium]|nr:TPM domain-containing protein [Anaerolineales bacterium]
MNAVHFFSKEEKEQIKSAVKEAELNTSGEIRVHMDNHCKEDVMDRAAWWFAKLNMQKTEQRNGVLFYLAVKDKKFAILGDAGINAVSPDNFWDSIQEKMAGRFAEGNFAGGLQEGILMAGQALKEHFPYEQGDVNELSDEISFGGEGQ